MMASSALCSKTSKYDVFLSFRGEDTRKTFVDHLYSALERHCIRTYKDDVSLPRGDSIRPSLFNAIEESQIAVVIFSDNYADSSWCLDELEHIMKCRHERGQIVLPVFYNVDPSDVRKQKRRYEEAFSKHEWSQNIYQMIESWRKALCDASNIGGWETRHIADGHESVFGKAFAKHKLDNNNKVESWRKALFDASNIAGWETKHIANGHEAAGIKIIVDTILDKLFSVDLDVDKKLVGMGSRFQYLESQLQLGSGGKRMVGIWGVGGGGKTTLAFSVYMKIRDRFQGHCFVESISKKTKHGLNKLQKEILSEVLKKTVSVPSDQEGRCIIERRLCRSNVLIVLDDVDDIVQLETLAGSCDWFGDGSRIIITTRNEQVLRSHRVDVVCPVSLLSFDEAIRLFRRHAYDEAKPLEDYDKLSLPVIKYVDGLPLALKILGSSLYGRDKNEWLGALDKLEHIPPRKVMDQLKISYDGLEDEEKDLFLDIACFHRGIHKDEATRKLDACGFNHRIGITVLMEKALLTISWNGHFDMHDLVQEMGHDIVRRKHPKKPEKHSRVWKTNEIASMFSGISTTAKKYDKIEAIQFICDDFGCFPPFVKLVSNMQNLRFLDATIFEEHFYDEGSESSYDQRPQSGYNEEPSFLSNELMYIGWTGYGASPFPDSFKATKLVVLKLHDTLQKELWKGCKHLPCLKELEVKSARHLVRTPDFGGLLCLQKLTLDRCGSLTDIDPSLGNHSRLAYIFISSCYNLTRFPTIVAMEKLETLTISCCDSLCEFPRIAANMDSLVNLCLDRVGIEVLPSSVGINCTNLISLQLIRFSKLKCIEGNFRALKQLQKFELACFGAKLEWLPKDLFDEKCHVKELCVSRSWGFIGLPPSLPHLPRSLRELNLSGLGLKDGEIPCEIGELSNLQELVLSRNNFSQLDFSLFQLTRLKLLKLSDCNKLVELPELPSNLSILEADHCLSLEAITDDVHKNCKCLCQVTINRSYGMRKSFVGGERLLETMLQGSAQSMILELKGIEFPKVFKPRFLVKGSICRLKLPENWFNEFSGFLFCGVHMGPHFLGRITMRQAEKQYLGDYQYLEDEPVFWEEESDYHNTWIGYVSFGSLRNTSWWDKTSTAFDIFVGRSSISGFGARLVSKKNQTEETATNNNSSDDDDDGYKCKFSILHDSRSHLQSV